ncbi:cytochrome C oxidase subunit IV family protein [Shewanella sp. SR44-3]|uniref:cytochrome C oxidase subunit IV family protein n=1 Tax=unclassified Shewanella TaxID=196818 RepID=UPI0015F9D9EC|nr:cytochrome C oxidase subunit IV family protein [Shewanella sp. SR44-3]MBB1270086.1 cytochrome C oxidase subunit IV family protein [Shewanella sp. SR44-3]
MASKVIKRLLAAPVTVWMVLILLTLISAAFADSSVSQTSVGLSKLSLLLVGVIVLVKGNLVIDYFMGLKHTRGWPVRIMKTYLALMLALIASHFFRFL